METLNARVRCPRCLRASSLCLCHRVKPFTTQARFVILLHPKEARRTVGTARIVRLCLPDTVLVPGIGADFDKNPDLKKLLEDPAYEPQLLFPGPRSAVLNPITKSSARRPLILLIDGTWPQAKKMLSTSPLLQSLPQVRLSGTRRSGYRFRRQPAPHCLSTVEAVHQVIEELSPTEQAPEETLLIAFDELVESQLLSARHGVATRPPC